jgi:DEAD/DEAH box helicase domain-containing protein
VLFSSLLEGFLPLFGLPVRNAMLLHEDPNFGANGRRWPIEKGKIDRSLDIAIAEFAPDSELTKDKEIIRSVGVAWPERKRAGADVWINSGPPALPRTLRVCRYCQTIAFDSATTCDRCGSAGDQLLEFTSWSPAAFVADFDGIRAYDGHIDRQPKTVLSFPLGLESSYREAAGGNYVVSSYPGTLVRTNTNNYAGYAFHRVNSNMLRGFYLAEGLDPPVRTERWLDPATVGEHHVNVALSTERKTDILLVRAKAWPPKWDHSRLPSRYKLRAAWTSAAEILGRAIVLREDIEPTEVSVGTRYEPYEDPLTQQQRELWGVFIADNLDNGAGYSSNYATREAFDELVRFATSRLGADWNAERHAQRCFGSCYECLRHYGNRFSHGALDWRLGLDIIAILQGETLTDALKGGHWKDVVGPRLVRRLVEFGAPSDLEWSVTGEYVVVRSPAKGVGFVPLHPLVNRELVRVAQLADELSEETGLTIAFCCPYELERQPLSEMQRLSETVRRRRA